LRFGDSAFGYWSIWSIEDFDGVRLISTELYRILKAKWLSAFAKAHDNVFSFQKIRAGFRGAGILSFDPLKVQDSIQVRPLECTTPYKHSVLTSSPLYSTDAHLANVALLTEILPAVFVRPPPEIMLNV
jgi:hypothetical protein